MSFRDLIEPIQVTTNNVEGKEFVYFAYVPCVQLEIINDSPHEIDFKRKNFDTIFTIFPYTARKINGIGDSSDIGVRRTDLSKVPIVVKAESCRAVEYDTYVYSLREETGSGTGGSGESGYSGYSGYSGEIGPQGDSGYSGYSGYSGTETYPLLASYLAANFTLAAASGVQSAFSSSQDVFTIEATTTYEFWGQYILNTGSTTHTTAMAFALGGGASVQATGGFEYTTTLWNAAANTIATAQSTTHVSGVASKVLNATSTAVYTIIYFRGVMRTNAAGTITPQINFSANPTGTNLMKANSFIVFQKRGAHNLTVLGSVA